MDGARDRIAWIDAARGMGIVLVVLGHAERGLVAAGIAQGSFWQWLDFSIYTFHMPLFFFLAGLNVPHALRHGRRPFVQDKLWTIAYPYLLWSVVVGSITVALSGTTNGHKQVGDLLAIGWKPIGQFWFLYVLMLCQLVAAALGGRPGLLAGIAALCLLARALLVTDGVPLQFLYALPFFAIGILVSPVFLQWRQFDRLGRGVLATLLATAALAPVIFLTGKFTMLNYMSLLALPAALVGIAAVIFASRTVRGWTLIVATKLGVASMTIYILHVLFTAGVRIAMSKAGVPHEPWLYLAVATAAGVVGPFLAHELLRRGHMLGWLGLGPSPIARLRSH